MDSCRLPTSSEVDEEALRWMDDRQDGDSIHQDGTIKEQNGQERKQHTKPINHKLKVDEEALTLIDDPQGGDKNLQDETDRCETPDKQGQRAKAMSRNTKKEPMEKLKQALFDPFGTDSEELIIEILDDLDDDEKRSRDESPLATGASESGMDAVIPPPVDAVNTDRNNDDADGNNKGSGGNNVFNSATRIKNLEEELGISDGLGNAGILIEMPADHGSSKGDNATSFSLANVLGHSRRHSLRKKSTRSVANTNDQNSNEKFPEDSYSFIAMNGPEKNRSWSRERLLFFLFGFLPFIFQMVFFGLLLFSQTNELRGTIGETDNPDKEKEGLGTMAFFASFIPANSTPIIRWAQVTSLAAYLIFPDASLQDMMRSIRLFPRASKREIDHLSLCVVLSCLLRLVQGVAAMIVTLLLVLTSTTVVDIILNFTAVNFISDLDEYAFSLAKTGEFSPAFQDEAERIANTELPCCMLRGKESRWKCNKIVGGLVSMIFLAALIFVFSSQDSHAFWVTGILRVQLQDSELNQYSGCFGINTESSSMNFSKRTYHSLETGHVNSNTSFGYCREERQWVLYKGKTSDPCNISDRTLALSLKTDSFDISTVFDEPWVTPSNTPIDLYFFEGKNETKIEEECKHVLGDGICDPVLNIGGYGYDDGDCCAATCTKSNCGRGGLTSVFGDSNVSGDGFEHCIDTNMYPITIHLNDITSSRNPKFTGLMSWWDVEDDKRPWVDADGFEEWKKVKPVNPYFAIDCDGKNIMTAYIKGSMVNKSQTVMVQDGAACTLVVRNSTTGIDILTDDPIWLIDYTIFHTEVNVEDGNVEILTGHSDEVETMNFQRIPECYFNKLQNHIDLKWIYAVPAIKWLLKDDTGNSRCDDSNFIERYALVSINFDMNTTENAPAFIREGNQCTWPSIICNKGNVNEIKVRDAGLRGPVPTELGLLPSLEALQLSCDQVESLKHLANLEGLKKLDLSSSESPCYTVPKAISLIKQIESLDLTGDELTALPSWIGQLSSLQTLYLDYNQLTTLPSSIVELSSLQTLTLSYNGFTTLPPWIGELSSLQTLTLYNNDLTTLPSSIEELSSLQTLDLSDNGFTALPPWIGQLSSLQTLYLDYNDLATLPSSIGELSSLQTLRLYYNDLATLPSSIGELSSLQTFDLNNNDLTTLPSWIGQLSSLQTLDLHYNQLTTLPSSIGELSSLQTLDLGHNGLTALPSSIVELSSLQTLQLDSNFLFWLPSSIGEVSSLLTLNLYSNFLTAVPSSIGELSSLQTLYLDYNQLTTLPSSIVELSSLQTLTLSGNGFTTFPFSIVELSSLLTLNLYYNQLTTLPSSIGELSSLQTLELAHNGFTKLPPWIGELSSLQTLDLGHNQLSTLPSSIWDLTNMLGLYLEGNTLNCTAFDCIRLCASIPYVTGVECESAR